MYRGGSENAVVVKDVIPYRLRKRTVEASYKEARKEKRELKRVQVLTESKEKLESLRKDICMLLQMHVKQNNIAAISNFGADFLQQLLEDTKLREKELSTAVMGEQKCVEMSEEVVKQENLSQRFIESAVVKRHVATERLKLVVIDREAVFSCLELLNRRQTTPTTSGFGGELPSEVVEYAMIKSDIEKNLHQPPPARKSC